MPSVIFIGSPNVPIPPVRGGAMEMWVEQVSKRLVEYQVTILSPMDSALPKENRDFHRHYLRIPQNGLFARIADKIRLDPLRYCRKACERIEYLDPDIVHVMGRPLFIPFLRHFFPNARLILHMMNTWEQIGSRSRPIPGEKIHSDVFVGCSQFILDTEKNRLGFGAADYRILTNGVDVGKFRPFHASPDRDAVRLSWNALDRQVLFFSGRLNEKKGILTILDALPVLLNEFPNLLLVVAGAPGFGNAAHGRREFMRHLQERFSQLDYYVHFTGFVPPDEIHKCYEAADVFVAPSIWDEPLAFVHLEASAAALPIVASRRGGTPELIEHGRNGLLVENPEDPTELADAVRRILKNREEAKRMGEEARKIVMEKHDWDLVTAQTKALYTQLFKRPVGGAV